MPYIVPNDLANKLAIIRIPYTDFVKKDLNTASQPWWISCECGATNILARKNQITLLETIYKTQLSRFFNQENQLTLNDTSPKEDINAYFDGMRVLIAATFYIKSEISALYWLRSATHSKLFNLIDEALALPEGNIIDEPTRNCALATTEAFMNRTAAPQVLDQDLIALNAEPEWEKFRKFIAKQCTDLKIEPTNYPITQFLMPVFAKPFQYAGYAVGWTVAEFFAQSTFTQRHRLNLTEGLGGLLYTLAGGGGVMAMGVGFVAPTIAARLFTHYAEITLAGLLGATMSLIGQGAGALVGVPLDMTYWAACYAVASLSSTNDKPLPPISGFNLVNGDCYNKGIRIQTIEENQKIEKIAVELYNSTTVNLTDNAIEIQVRNASESTAIIPRNPNNLSENQQAVIQELKAVFEATGILSADQPNVEVDVAETAVSAQEISTSGNRLSCTPSAFAL